LTDFNSLTKSLLLLLLLLLLSSKDYYKKALISIIAVVLILMNCIVFAFNIISRNQCDMRRIRMERVCRGISR